MATAAGTIGMRGCRVEGAAAFRDLLFDGFRVGGHSHGCATLTIPLIGGFTSMSDDGEAIIAGAAAMYHPPNRGHAAINGECDTETVNIAFDPGWLSGDGARLNLDRSHHWIGGRAGAAALQLARLWAGGASTPAELRGATVRFFVQAIGDEKMRRPGWLGHVEHLLGRRDRQRIGAIAETVGLNPAWLSEAYRQSTGERPVDTMRRRRVERAAARLRRSSAPLADVALASGFCDQSHMNRCFRAVLGRTPREVRNDATHRDAGYSRMMLHEGAHSA